MKIGILTLPLHKNYGGLLQAYALQTFLKRLGHEPILIKIQNHPLNYINPKDIIKSITRRHTNKFANLIDSTNVINSIKDLSVLKNYNFDAFIVGSDQVWRPSYTPDILTYFLNFVEEKDTKRIAYAASFGHDSLSDWNMNDIFKCSLLAKKFNAISVREYSGIKLCEKYFGVTASHLVDPTLLLTPNDYIDLFKTCKIRKTSKQMMVYILDKNKDKELVVKTIAKEKGLTPYSIMPKNVLNTYPPVTKWLASFMNSDYVVTDSYHGVIFSIIFNKPFIAIGNKRRGLARFDSLLNRYNLLDRFIISPDQLTLDKINKNLDYKNINQEINMDKVKSTSFFINSLNQ